MSAILESTPTPPAPRPRRWGPGRVRAVVAVAVGVLGLVVGLAVWLPHRTSAGASTPSKVPVSWQRHIVTAAGLPDRSGVLITRVAVTGGGGLVDLRYRVVDPDKAASVHDARTPPAVVDEQSGLVVHQLFMDHSHSGPYKPGITYYLVFNNPGNWVHHGSKVTVLLGNSQVEHVVVP